MSSSIPICDFSDENTVAISFFDNFTGTACSFISFPKKIPQRSLQIFRSAANLDLTISFVRSTFYLMNEMFS